MALDKKWNFWHGRAPTQSGLWGDTFRPFFYGQEPQLKYICNVPPWKSPTRNIITSTGEGISPEILSIQVSWRRNRNIKFPWS